MHVLAIFAINEHIAELTAEADRERTRRALRPERHDEPRGFVASFLAALRDTLVPGSRQLDAWPHRG